MFRLLLLSTLVLYWQPSPAQQAAHHQSHQAPKITVPQSLKAYKNLPPLTGEEPAKGKYMPTSRYQKNNVGVEIGKTRYDLQSNASMCRRVLNEGNGNIHAMWTMALQDDFGDRGTGYNVSSDGGDTWQTAPSSRLESVRTGWPNIGKTESGRLFSISHSSSGLHFAYQDEAGETWREVSIGANLGDAVGLWARVATAGNTIHVIIGRRNEYVGSGIDGGILYFRSKDAGDTWEGPIDIEPSMADILLDSGGDNYAMDANGDKIALVIGNFGSQVILYQSTDDGDTWARTIVVPTTDPFLEDILDPVATSNGHHAIIIDDSGKIHLWFNRFYAFRDHNTLADSGSVFILDDSAGIMYWNEDMGSNAPVLIGKTVRPDDDGDGETTVDDGLIALRGYRFGIVSQPSAGVDANGNLYVAYSSPRDGAIQEGSEGTRIYRDIYLIKSTDGGTTWQGPLNVSDNATTEDVFPHLARLVDDQVHLVFQSDAFAGTNIQVESGGHEQIVDNSIRYVKIPIEAIADPNEPDQTLPLTFRAANSSHHFALVNCEPDYATFFSGHSIDYPDGDLTNVTKNISIDVSEAGEEVGLWTFSITDKAGNTRTDSLINGTSPNYWSMDLVDVLEDVEGPIIFPEPFGNFFQDEFGDIQFNTFFDFLDTIAIIVNTPYEDLGAFVLDPPGSNFEAPDYGNIYGCQPTLFVDNPVDATTLGTYVVTYTAVDINGNTQADFFSGEPIAGVKRVVHVIEQDTKAPQIILNADVNGHTDALQIEVNRVPFWEDPGVLVFDNVDLMINQEDVSSTIVDENGMVVDEVNTNTVNKFTITYTVADAAGNIATAHREVTVVDTAPPVITLTPPPTVGIACNGEYVELGYTALDAVDGLITDHVEIAYLYIGCDPPISIEEIPTWCAGTYAITYNVSDASGNAAAEVSRVVFVSGDCMDPDCPIPVTSPEQIIVTLTDGDAIILEEGQTDLTDEFTVTTLEGMEVTSKVTIDDAPVDYFTSGTYELTLSYGPCEHKAEVRVQVIVSTTVDISNPVSSQNINIYPNPTNGLFNIAFNLNKETINIQVFNIFGEVIGAPQQLSANQQVKSVDLSQQPEGIYFIQINTKEGSYTQKVIVGK